MSFELYNKYLIEKSKDLSFKKGIFKSNDLVLKAQKDINTLNYLKEHPETLKLILFCVNKYKGCYEPEELMGIGFIGFLKAIKDFKPYEYGDTAFTTYAVPKIQAEIRSYVMNNYDGLKGIKVSRYYTKAKAKLRSTFGDAIFKEDEKIIDFLLSKGYTLSTSKYIVRALKELNHIKSFDDEIQGGDSSDKKIYFKDIVGKDDNEIIENIAYKQFKEKIIKYFEKNPGSNGKRLLILQCLLQEMKQVDTAKAVGMSQSHVSRVIKEMKKQILRILYK